MRHLKVFNRILEKSSPESKSFEFTQEELTEIQDLCVDIKDLGCWVQIQKSRVDFDTKQLRCCLIKITSPFTLLTLVKYPAKFGSSINNDNPDEKLGETFDKIREEKIKQLEYMGEFKVLVDRIISSGYDDSIGNEFVKISFKIRN